MPYTKLLIYVQRVLTKFFNMILDSACGKCWDVFLLAHCLPHQVNGIRSVTPRRNNVFVQEQNDDILQTLVSDFECIGKTISQS